MTAGNYQYAEVLVNGKTGSRTILLFNSIPFIKGWLDDHPQMTNPNFILSFLDTLDKEWENINSYTKSR
jgi:hypothetical protein